MLQQKDPDDFVVATGEQHSIRELCEVAFREVGIDIDWEGKEQNERGIDRKTGKEVIGVDPVYYRPTEVETLLGDPTKAKNKLGWEPKVTFEGLIKEMVAADLDTAKRDALVKREGFEVYQSAEEGK